MTKIKLIPLLLSIFILSYCSWGIVILANQFGYLQFGTPVATVFFMLGGLSPTIVAYIMLKKQNIGFRAVTKELFKVKAPLEYYFLVIIFIIMNFGIAFFFSPIVIGIPLYIAILQLPMMIVGGGIEEIAWRYILQPSLEKKFPFFIATSFTACIWSLWHIPLFLIEGTLPNSLNFGVYVIQAFGLSFEMASIFYVSKNIWLCVLFHAMNNAFASAFIIPQSVATALITTISIMTLSLIIVNIRKRRHLQKQF